MPGALRRARRLFITAREAVDPSRVSGEEFDRTLESLAYPLWIRFDQILKLIIARLQHHKRSGKLGANAPQRPELT
jgi:hypothetical protein